MKAHLTVTSGKELGRRYVVPEGSVLLGRGRDVAIQLEDMRISRHHLSLKLGAPGLYVTDLDSHNGTYLSPGRLRPGKPVRVPNGETIRVGSHRLKVDLYGLVAAEEERIHRLLEGPALPYSEFEVLEKIGRGGMGTVWAARQKDLDRVVAVKVLRAKLSNDPTEQKRFLREAGLSCRINSPYVVRVFAVRLIEGRPHLIMELVQGPTAWDLLEYGPLPLSIALRIGEDVARALAAAAQVGVVHRDVKPSNILLTPSGMAKLADFGIAKDLLGTAMTMTGMGLGSLPYASPEQAMDAKLATPLTDIYGLGATLYHLVAGRDPFCIEGSRDFNRSLHIILNEEPMPLGMVRNDCPQAVEDLIHRMLSKPPQCRPSSANEVALELRRLRESCGPYGSGLGPIRRAG